MGWQVLRVLRSLLLLAVVVTFLVLLCVQFVSGTAGSSETVLLSVLIGLVYLLTWPQMRVHRGEPGPAPAIGAVLIAVAWLARMATAVTLTFLIAGRVHHLVFDRQVAGFVLVGGLLGMVHLLGNRLAGIGKITRRDWVRSLVNIPIAVAIGGFAQPLKAAAFYLLCWVPLWVFHAVAGATTTWLGVLVDIPTWTLWVALVFVVVTWLRGRLNRLLGPTNPISALLGDLKAEGEGVKAEVRTQPEHNLSVSIAPGLSRDWDWEGEIDRPARRRDDK
ncbi:MAG TPA: hypothetical protein VJ914_32275 [Pseudonocardiaceae bacterium]|nr:hypothetical protein [Pseudonocardiaceae bacterium]